MPKIFKINHFRKDTPMGARYVGVVTEHASSYSVNYYNDSESKYPIVANISPSSMVLSKEEFRAMTEAHEDPRPNLPKKDPGLAKREVKQVLRKADKGGDGDRHEDDVRGPMKFPHSKDEEEWADYIAFDPKTDVFDYPDYRQTGIDDSMFIYGKEAEKLMKKESFDGIELNTRGLNKGNNDDSN